MNVNSTRPGSTPSASPAAMPAAVTTSRQIRRQYGKVRTASPNDSFRWPNSGPTIILSSKPQHSA